ncbi:MAG: EF-hand domain-containing protein [Verrucomicrobia bacterium]|nr:EF-hand domain-containing protein [Verrucomicrobiota bacterium]
MHSRNPQRPVRFAFTILIATATFAISTGWVVAQAPGVFDQFDKNSDGKVTPDELSNATAFARFDIDHDGAITPAEYQQVADSAPSTPTPDDTGKRSRVAQIEAIAKQFDADGDGKITREEAAGAAWFERVDANGDGVADVPEIQRVKAAAARSKRGGGAALPETAPPLSAEDLKKITSGPEVLKPGDAGIGRMIPDAKFTTLDGTARNLADMQGRKALVIAMTSATCPVSKRYLPSLAVLAKEFAAQHIGLLLVNPFVSETTDEIKAQLAAAGLRTDYVHDTDKKLAAALQARTTTEVFLLDTRRTLLYRGALDDQYGINYNLDAPRHPYLRDAIAAFLQSETPPVQATVAPGCELDLEDAPKTANTGVTYHRDVARILQQNCVQCHRDGGIAPFALDDIEEVTDRAKVIRRVVTEGTMPPWFAAPEKDAAASRWANDISLSARDKADLLAWIESKDRPLGDAAEAPAKRVYPEEWNIGQPDLIVPLSRAYDIKATGFMPYQLDVVETTLTEDRWVTAYEILPSARDVVHHVIVQVHEPGTAVRNVGEGAGGYWAVYVPGNGSCVYPPGFARKLPAGARISFQIHYTPSGEAKTERLRLGLVFAKTAPRYEVRTVGVANRRIAIPPGAAHHVETQTQRVPFDMPVTSFMAHMHMRGKAFRYEVTHPDGKTETLLDIPRYDFNWQMRYDLKQPKLLPRGSTVKVTAVYDNSSANRANPDPTRLVKWGPQTVDEMMIGYLEYFTPVSGSVSAN